MRKLVIDGKTITDDGDCFVIAEVGHNHQGKLETAKEMFRVAKDCGADAVKLQKRDNRQLYTQAAYDKPYDHENSFGLTYGEHREALEFGLDEYKELMDYAKEIGITMFSTAFDFPSADFLAKLDVPALKIASGDLKSIPLPPWKMSIGPMTPSCPLTSNYAFCNAPQDIRQLLMSSICGLSPASGSDFPTLPLDCLPMTMASPWQLWDTCWEQE
jgi:hypothetical protein